jgi:hypothetical protein
MHKQGTTAMNTWNGYRETLSVPPITRATVMNSERTPLFLLGKPSYIGDFRTFTVPDIIKTEKGSASLDKSTFEQGKMLASSSNYSSTSDSTHLGFNPTDLLRSILNKMFSVSNQVRKVEINFQHNILNINSSLDCQNKFFGNVGGAMSHDSTSMTIKDAVLSTTSMHG